MAAQSDQDKRVKIEALYERARASFAGIPELTVDELRALQAQENVQLVDVRTPDEQVVSMIPGAITAREFEDNRKSYEGATVVTYCTIGGRSGKYAGQLVAEGLKAFNLKGAILAWTHGGGELVDAEGPTKRVHVHDRKFALTAEGYEPVW